MRLRALPQRGSAAGQADATGWGIGTEARSPPRGSQSRRDQTERDEAEGCIPVPSRSRIGGKGGKHESRASVNEGLEGCGRP